MSIGAAFTISFLVGPLLDAEVRAWLERQCAPL
jgi:hypothetical protein